MFWIVDHVVVTITSENNYSRFTSGGYFIPIVSEYVFTMIAITGQLVESGA
ncbi:MAG: hypothetical protein ACYDAJ_09835 [Nitrosotalea sp.]